MSSVKANRVQLGRSSNPLLNFTIMTPDDPNGTLEIRRGNEDFPGAVVMKINSDGSIQSNSPFLKHVNSLTNPIVIENGNNALAAGPVNITGSGSITCEGDAVFTVV